MFHCIESTGIDSNCYILESDLIALIDTGTHKNYRVYDYVDENDIQIDFIINTHCHFDHVGGNKFFEVPIYAHEMDYLDIKMQLKNILLGIALALKVMKMLIH